jgi:hypothetical protein
MVGWQHTYFLSLVYVGDESLWSCSDENDGSMKVRLGGIYVGGFAIIGLMMLSCFAAIQQGLEFSYLDMTTSKIFHTMNNIPYLHRYCE